MAGSLGTIQGDLFPEGLPTTPGTRARTIGRLPSTSDSIGGILGDTGYACPSCGEMTQGQICKCGAVIALGGENIGFVEELNKTPDIEPNGVDDRIVIPGSSYTFIVSKNPKFPKSNKEVLEVLLEIDGKTYKVGIYPKRERIMEGIYSVGESRGRRTYTRVSNFPTQQFIRIVAACQEIKNNPEKFGIENLRVMK